MPDNELDDIDITGVVHRPCPKRGVLTFWNLPDELQRREDSRLEADYSNRSWRASVPNTRPPTATERLLLQHIGYNVPDSLEVRVTWLSGGVRRREFPALEGQNS